MNIVLIGYRGTGKSVVGGLLANRYSMLCISMDERIIEKAGMSVPEIVDKMGWPRFRDLETAVARELAQQDNIIIDCGGGVIERRENIDVLQKTGTIIWLKASVDVIVSRICTDTQRPSLTEGKTFTGEVAEVLNRRTPLYEAAAHHNIDTDDLTPAEIADKIIRECL
ncbi:MAG: shikimate kinase [Thermodesulfobacteriota bacterium]|nr:shikimate kinase [Thermodesulfobacteriota bacterium]